MLIGPQKESLMKMLLYFFQVNQVSIERNLSVKYH
ncbi:Uncharacterised protein [Serratia marcescens]|nr:Uncharacterised protein [Serratia marcescens]